MLFTRKVSHSEHRNAISNLTHAIHRPAGEVGPTSHLTRLDCLLNFDAGSYLYERSKLE